MRLSLFLPISALCMWAHATLAGPHCMLDTSKPDDYKNYLDQDRTYQIQEGTNKQWVYDLMNMKPINNNILLWKADFVVPPAGKRHSGQIAIDRAAMRLSVTENGSESQVWTGPLQIQGDKYFSKTTLLGHPGLVAFYCLKLPM